jgi:predicted cobalt transporter CbtA
MDGDAVGIFVFLGFLAAIVLVPIWLRERTKQSAHQLISQALEKGHSLDPALLRQLTDGPSKDPQDRARRTLKSGIVLLVLGIGFGVAGFAISQSTGAEGAFGGMMVPAAILGALGIAFILLALVDYAAKKRDQ